MNPRCLRIAPIGFLRTSNRIQADLPFPNGSGRFTALMTAKALFRSRSPLWGKRVWNRLLLLRAMATDVSRGTARGRRPESGPGGAKKRPPEKLGPRGAKDANFPGAIGPAPRRTVVGHSLPRGPRVNRNNPCLDLPSSRRELPAEALRGVVGNPWFEAARRHPCQRFRSAVRRNASALPVQTLTWTRCACGTTAARFP